jgi:hypothetical protein
MKFAEIVVLSQDIYSKIVIDCNKKEKVEVIGTNSITVAIESYFDKIDIQVYSTQSVDDEVYGLYTRYNLDDKSILIDIDINSKLNTCWSRFVATKEIVHTIIDKETKSQTKDIVSLVSMLIANPPRLDFNDDIPSEYLALLFALELLVPYCYNDYIMDMSITSYKIAETFMVPEIIIDMLREDWYQELRNKSYK